MKTLFTFVTVVCSTVRDKRLTYVNKSNQSIYYDFRIGALFLIPANKNKTHRLLSFLWVDYPLVSTRFRTLMRTEATNRALSSILLSDQQKATS